MKREFVINRQGKDYVLYAGLLDEAHQQGLQAIKTQLVQAPTPQNGNVAICFAEVATERGTFTGIGDADPGNVNRVMANALIRMAETRAKARALRDAVNVAMLSVEELSEGPPESLLTEDSPAAALPPARIVSLPSVRQAIKETANAFGGGPAGDAAATGPAGPALAAVAPPAVAGPAGPGGPAGQRAPARGGAKPAPQGPPPPATQTQLETIAKLARSVGREVPTHDLTRAAASELITRLSEERYGARRES
jgi:hypothetical protein